MYNLCQLSRTTYDVASTLKQKIIEKIPNLHFPRYIKNIYDFDLEFHLPEFPPLPTCEFGLAFQLSLPGWCFFGSLSSLKNDFKKRSQIVVSTKCNIHNFL